MMLPGDANPAGNVHGGAIMRMVDTAAGVAVTRHARGRTVTARIDSMSFLQPVFVGDLVTVKASVNDVGTTSLEVGVRVEAEDLNTGAVRHVSSAYLVFVALDQDGRPRPVPGLIAETAADRQRSATAKLRRQHRLAGEEAIRSMAASGPRQPRPALRFPPEHGPIAVVHMGASGEPPENTIAAFVRAVGLKADFIELDVHLSQDGVPVVIHDDELGRTANGMGAVREATLAELKELEAGLWMDPPWPGQRIPTLGEVLESFGGKARFLIEMKSGPSDSEGIEKNVAEEVCKAGRVDSVVVISFDHRAVLRLRRANPELATGVVFVGRAVDPVGLARAADADLLVLEWTFVIAEDVRRAHEAGLSVFAWTVDQPEAIRGLADAGVDGIIAKRPDRVVEVRGSVA